MCHVLSGLAYLVPPLPISRATGSCTRTFPFRFTCLFTCTSMDCRLVSGYLFVSHFPFCLVDSSTYASHLRLSPFVSSTRLCLPFVVRQLVSRMFVLVSRRPLYIQLGMGTCSPSSIYFPTTLKVRPVRSHELSSSSLVHWSRLLLCVFLGVILLCLLAYR